MSYQVIARKYRPQSFDDVVGQPIVTTTLKNAITSGRIAHAFLFSGVRGVGKTTSARILAKALNCQQGLTPAPCGECDSCLEIAASSSVDVQEIDAASNTGVDSIRELRESVRYGTARDRFKIFIIDEVHMLSNAAFNALLKTLEEPPEHVKFIMATTESHKIPVTITSRCQHFEFKPIGFGEILARLKKICSDETIEISDYALRAIANEGRGSMRDAQSALDRILSFGGGDVSDEQARALLGVVDEQVMSSLVEAVLGQDRQALLEGMEQAAESGVDPLILCRELIQHLRNLMVCQVAGWDQRLLHLPDSQRESLEEQAEKVTQLDLIRFYDLLSRTENELKWNPHPHVHLEIALMKMVELARLPALEEVIGRLQGGPGATSHSGGAASPSGSGRKVSRSARPQSRRTSARAAKQPLRESKADRSVAPTPATPPSAADTPPWEDPGAPAEKAAPEATEPDRPSPSASPNDQQALPSPSASSARQDVGQRLLDELHDRDPSLHALLPEPGRIRLEQGKLRISFPSDEAVSKGLAEQRSNVQVLRDLCGKITGSSVQVEFLLEDGQADPGPESDPRQDPKVQAFLKAFPGKYVVDRNPQE